METKLIHSEKKNWYVLYTTSRAEKKVRDRLTADGYECWLPLHKSPRVWSDRVKIVEVPLFPSYLFVYCKETELKPLVYIDGIVRALYNNKKPAVVRQKEIDAIKLFLEQAANHVLCPGEDVEIICGAMKHVSGKIRLIKKKYLTLHVDPIGATVCVDIEKVVPAKNHRISKEE